MKILNLTIIFLALISSGYSGEEKQISEPEIKNEVDGGKQSEDTEKSSEPSELGRSIENPIVLVEKDLDKAEEVQQLYIKKHYPGYSIKADMLTVGKENHTIQSFTLRNKDEDEVTLFFDIDIAFKEFERKNRKELRKLEKAIGDIFE